MEIVRQIKDAIILSMLSQGFWAAAAKLTGGSEEFKTFVLKIFKENSDVQKEAFNSLWGLLTNPAEVQKDIEALPRINWTPVKIPATPKSRTVATRRVITNPRTLAATKTLREGSKPLARKYSHWTQDPKNRNKVIAAQKKAVAARKRNNGKKEGLKLVAAR